MGSFLAPGGFGGYQIGGIGGRTAATATIAQSPYGAEATVPSGQKGKFGIHHAAIIVPAVGLGWLIWLRWSLPK